MRMDEPRHIPEVTDHNPNPSEPPRDGADTEAPTSIPELVTVSVPCAQAAEQWPAATAVHEGASERRRIFRRNSWVALSLALVAFTLTSWILVRTDSPFGIFATGPQGVVRAQLRALDLGELKPAYDMFSPRYRSQVSFAAWHELCVDHWRMFHASVIRADQPEPSGASILLEIYLRSADDTHYRARFTVIRADGRWWIDDVHWMEEPSSRECWRT
jgi:hypothetical protein